MTSKRGPERRQTLSERQKKHLRRLAHALKPIVTLGTAGPREMLSLGRSLALAPFLTLGRS